MNRKGVRVFVDQTGEVWHKWRSQGIGGSDAAVIMLGKDFPFQETVQSLWATRTGRVPPKVIDNKFTERGNQLEPVARELFNRRTGLYTEPMCFENGSYPFVKASLDGMTMDGNVIVEIKCPTNRHQHHLDIKNQEQFKEQAPIYFTQMQHQFLATGAAVGYFVSYNPDFAMDKQIHIIEVLPDFAFIETLLRRLQNFWRCVETDIMPSDESSDVYPLEDHKIGNVGIIQIFGFARSGKDTVGRAIKEIYGSERFAYADPLKDVYCEVAGLTREQLDNEKEKHRSGLVGLGKGMRAVSPDVWATGIYLPEKGFTEAAKGKGAYITDGRYLNEHIKAKLKAVELQVPYRSVWIDASGRGIIPANLEESDKTSVMQGICDITIENDVDIADEILLRDAVEMSVIAALNYGTAHSIVSGSADIIHRMTSV